MRVFELAVSFGLILAGASQAATIFSTGVDNSGVALPLGGPIFTTRAPPQ